MNIFEQIFLVVLGLCLGSFANVCIYRIPLNQSLIKPGSHCPNCERSLQWRHNIPLFSFLFLRARCAFCRQPISLRYPFGEAGFAMLFWVTVISGQARPEMVLAGGFLVFVLWVISFIDLSYMVIPNMLSLGLLLIGFIFSPWNSMLGTTFVSRVLYSLIGGTFGFILMFLLAWSGEKVFRREAMGGGDIKLMAGLGVFLGWRGVCGTLFIASIAGTIWGLGLIVFNRAGRNTPLPFGPFLALGAWLVWVTRGDLIFASLLMPWGF